MSQLDYRIPIIDKNQYAGTYWEMPVDPQDPRYDEPLVRLESVQVAYESYHARTDGGNPPYHRPVEGSRKDVWSRKSLAGKLAAANERLRPYGMELFILDGYRPIACQRGLWDFYYREAQRTLGHSSEEEYRAFALTYIADPAPFDEKDSATWPAHTTGASVDLTLRELATGRLADMGSNFEEITETSSSDFFERLLDKGEIEEADPRLQNRRMMHWAMHEQGILNDPFVFWHHDWGNQHYVKTWRALFPNPPAAAWYGYIAPPPE